MYFAIKRDVKPSEGYFNFSRRNSRCNNHESKLRWEIRVVLVLSISTIARAVDTINAEPLLVRQLHVYKHFIRDVQNYFHSNNIVLLLDSLSTKSSKEIDDLLDLQRYLSGILNVPTSIMDFPTLTSRPDDIYESIERPLFILLNDANEIRQQLISVSRWMVMAHPTWLLFLRNQTRLEDFLSDVYVPFNAIFMVAETDTADEKAENGEVITEVYRTGKREDLTSKRFGTWSIKKGLQGPELTLRRRRNNLQGQTIRLGATHSPPDTLIIRDQENRVFGVGGISGDVLELLKVQMNCTYIYSETNKWGTRRPDGTFTGLLKELLEDRADITVPAMTMFLERLDAARFVSGVSRAKVRVYIQRPDSSSVKWDAYSAPFVSSIWIAITVIILVTGLTFIGIDTCATKKRITFADNPTFCSQSAFFEVIFFIFGAFCDQGMSLSSLDSLRLVELNINLTAVVVLAAYSAALISFLTVKTFAMPFTTIDGMLEDGTYQFSTVRDSGDYAFFQDTHDPVLMKVFKRMLFGRNDLPKHDADGLSSICEKNRYAFLTRDTIADIMQGQLDCILQPLSDCITVNVRTIAVPINSPYLATLNRNINLMRESGVLRRIFQKRIQIVSPPDSEWKSVEMNDVLSLFLFLTIAYLVSSVILLVERLVYRRCGTGGAS